MGENSWYLDRETAERLLDGSGSTPQTEVLARLLSYAAAPGRPHELSGQDSAVAAFRAVRETALRRGWWRRWLTLKATAAVLGVVTAGGLAFASGTGIIPGPSEPDSVPSQAPASSQSASAHPHPTAGPGTSAATPDSQLPTEALRGLCRAYQGASGAERGKELEKAALQDLVRSAGGAHRVDRYCAEALAREMPDQSHRATPDQPSPRAQLTVPPDQQPQRELPPLR